MTLFFALIILAVISYGVQIPLLTKYARAQDGLTITIYRGASITLAMLPVLLFVKPDEIAGTAAYILHIAAFGAIGAIAFTLTMSSAAYLPIAITHSFRQVSAIVSAILFGIFIFNEFLSPVQVGLIISMLALSLALSLSKLDVLHLSARNIPLGILMALGAGVAWASSVVFFTLAARNVSPIAAGYFLEVSVFVFAALLGFLRHALFRIPVRLLSLRGTFAVAAISTTAIIGTLAYSFAINLGPYTLAAALLSITGVIALVGGSLLLNERLSRFQSAAVLAIIGIVFMLQLL